LTIPFLRTRPTAGIDHPSHPANFIIDCPTI
jgi:hypothetical protein